MTDTPTPPPKPPRNLLAWLVSPPVLPWLVAASSALLLAAAHVMQAYGMFPCDLCLRQREAYWIAIPFALAAALLPRWKRAPRLLAPALMAIAAAALLYGAGRAFQHIGVVAHWWVSACSVAKNLSIDEVMNGHSPPLVACDAAPKFFGISLPIYNFVAALGLAGLAALVPWRAFMRKRG